MNRMYTRFIAVASLLIGGSLFLGGCGPQDINDPDYMAQMKADDAANDDGKMDDKAAAPANGDARPAAVAGGPAAVPVAGVAVPPPLPVVVLPPQFVRAPDAVIPRPPIVIPTGEQRNFQQDINHYREIRVMQPTINRHNINNTLLRRHRYATRVINMPSSSTVVSTTGNTIFAQEVLPTEVVTLPPVVAPPVFVGPGPGCGGFLGGAVGCPTPFYGRGNFFSCNRPLL